MRHFGIRTVIIQPGFIAPGMKPLPVPEHDPAYQGLWDEWSGLDVKVTGPSGRPGPEIVGAAVLRAVEDETTPLRVPVGDDAHLILAARSQLDDASFEAAMRTTLDVHW